MLLIRSLAPILLLAAIVSPALAQLMPQGGVRIVYAFQANPEGNCEIELTRDSVRFLSEYIFMDAPASESIQESAERRVVGSRVLTSGEQDTAQALMALVSRWKGYRRYVCKAGDGYAYSLWSDSLLLNCDNCYNCADGLSVPDARVLARFGRMSLWLYGLRQAWRPQ